MKIITGNPGTGKHTIAKQISSKLNLEVIDINKIAIDKRSEERRVGKECRL